MRPHSTIKIILTVFLCVILSSTILLREGIHRKSEGKKNLKNEGTGFTRDFTDDDFWAECSTVKLYTTTRSKETTPVWDSENDTIKLSMARNEYESFQLAFRPLANIHETITIPQLEGPSVLGTGNYSLYDVEYAGSYSPDPLVPLHPDHNGSVYPPTGEPGWRSWDIDIPSSVTTAIWVTVYMPPHMPAGTYRANITFTQSGGNATRMLEVDVWDFTLPENPTLNSWFESSSGSYPAYYPFNNLDQEHVDFMKKVYRKFKSHRITPGKLCTIEPWNQDFVVDANHTVTVNFTRSDPLMEYYMDELGLHRFEFPLTAYNPVRWDTGEYDFSFSPYEPTENYTHVIGQYIKQVADHYREKGWLDRCVLYYCDEPYAYTIDCNSPHQHPPYSLHRYMDDIIKANAPDLRHLITKTIEPSLYGSGEIWDAPHAQYHLNDAARRQELGEECWWYNVGGGIDKLGIGLRALYWHSFKERVDGVEHWGMNYWNYNTINNDPWLGSTADGNGYMFYPGSTVGIDDDIIISIRLELTRDGMEDYEYLVKYAEIFGRESAEAISDMIIPASEFAEYDSGEVDDIALYSIREYVAEAIENGGESGMSLWRHCLNGTKSGPGPWDSYGMVNDYGNEGISSMDGLFRSWFGDGAVMLAMDEKSTLLSDCDDDTGWLPSNQPTLNSSISVETSPEKHIEGSSALNFSFWRNGDNISQLYNSRVQSNTFSIRDWSEYDLLEFDCAVEDMSLNNFFVELGFQGGSWYDRIGKYSRTGMIPGMWHHCIIDISELDRTDLDHIQIFTHNNKLEVPFHPYSLLLDNITLRSANRTISGNVTFDPIDTHPVTVGKWYVEVLGDQLLFEDCSTTVYLRGSSDGNSWDNWREVPKEKRKLFCHSGRWLLKRYSQIRINIAGSTSDRRMTPAISEVRMWYAPMIYADIGLSPSSFRMDPEVPTAGEEINFEFEVVNRGEVGIGPTELTITADDGKEKIMIWSRSQYISPGSNAIITDDLTLPAGDYVLNITLVVPLEVIDPYPENNSLSLDLHVNAPPVAVISAVSEAESHKQVIFDAADSYDADGEIVSYVWDMGDGTVMNGSVVAHTYLYELVFEVTLTVEDDLGANATAAHAVDVGHPVPTVEIIHTPGSGTVETEYQLHASVFDPLGEIREYTWLFPDGQERKGERINWRFSDDGTHNVSLSVSLKFPPFKVATHKHIRVENTPPDVVGSATLYEASPGEMITFTSTGTKDIDDEYEQLRFRWDFGDGIHSTQHNDRHQYDNAGRYTVNLTVTDDDEYINWTTFEIYVHSEFPIAEFEVPETFVNERVVFNGSPSMDPDGEVVTYIWELRGQGINGSLFFFEKAFEHMFLAAGNYTINLTVVDNTGDKSTIEKTFHVGVRDTDGDGVPDSEEKEGSNTTTIIIIIVSLAVMSIGIFIFFRYGRKAAPEITDDEEKMDEYEKEKEKEKEKEMKRKELYEDIYGGPEKKDDDKDKALDDIEWLDTEYDGE